jgi:XTP/dITP diphosphohydrolase
MREIIVATGNRGKLREITELLSGLPVKLSSLADHWFPVPSIPETGDTFLANALQKASWVFERKGMWVLADDSGLEVDALGGRPGVRSARFAGENCDPAANNTKLLELLADVPPERRTARFKCVTVLVCTAESYFHSEGVCEGSITLAPRGTGGFGYDPLFVPAGFSGTFGEMKQEDKHAISHRGRALQKIRDQCNELLSKM